MKELNISANDQLVYFGQLFGMCDQVSFTLGKLDNNFKVCVLNLSLIKIQECNKFHVLKLAKKNENLLANVLTNSSSLLSNNCFQISAPKQNMFALL